VLCQQEVDGSAAGHEGFTEDVQVEQSQHLADVEASIVPDPLADKRGRYPGHRSDGANVEGFGPA
jgi:hypothetical protein